MSEDCDATEWYEGVLPWVRRREMKMTFTRAFGRIFNNVTSEFPKEYKSIKKCLPKVPVPDLEKTLNRYLEYASVIAAGQGKNIEATRKAVEDFTITGVDAQHRLKEIAASDVNWVNRFWLPEMYLRIRLPLPVNSNPAYVFPKQTFEGADDKLRYTAILIRGLVEFKDAIDRKSIDRELSTGVSKQNMCMVQYDRVLGCYRQPRLNEDVQHVRNKNNKGDEHVTLMSDNQAFLIRTRVKGELVPAAGVLRQLQEATRVSANRAKEIVVPIGAASVGERNDAAACWEELLKVEENVQSVGSVLQSLFVVCLDDGDNNNTIPNASLEKRTDGVASYSEETLVESGLHLLTGGGSRAHGLNRWYDASIQVVVRSDGLSGLCIEHSAAEGIVIIQMVESALRYVRKHEGNNLMFTSSGDLSFAPRALTWVVSEEARKLMDKQREDFDELHGEMQLEALIFDDFGKEKIKGWKVSPDGFIQLAMQLAHYRLHGYLVSTYESASIRRFAEGRVDNIRAATPEALQWVTAMAKADEPKLWPSSVISFDLVRRALNVGLEERIRLFRKAAQKQAAVTVENISGLGIDNHLCALSVIASSLGKSEHPLFTDPLWAEALRFPLSTSQVTTSLDLEGSYLCYGAVVRDGYGCAYNIMPNRIIFAPSAFRSNARTNLAGFKNAIRDALREMKSLLDRE